MSSSPVDEIKNRLDVIEVIGSYIKLEKAGRNFRARCPFHSEKSPSFMVSPERQIWHCFGCGLGGDIFAFVKQIEGVEFGDALRLLAQRAGVVLKRQDPAIDTQRRRLYEICELAEKFFETQLQKSKPGINPLNYLLKERGLTPQTIKDWRLGWAPDEWHSLCIFLQERGYTEQEILNSGLAIQSDKAQVQSSKLKVKNFYDRFRSRIIFPLFDIQGQVVGFAGRIFGKEDENVGKYINTPQTVLYDKSRLLYGLNFAKTDLRQKNYCVFVEGNLDVIMSHQAEVKNAVATSGTALTAEHLKIIRRYTDNLLFAFDMDPAGENATRRSIDLALENDFSVKIINMTEKDTADLVCHNASAWQKAIDEAISIMDFYFSSTLAKYPSLTSGRAKPEDKKQIAKILLPIIKRLPNEIERSHWIGELSRVIKTDEKILYAEIKKTKTEPASPSFSEATSSAQPEKTRVQELEERLITLYLNFPDHLKNLTDIPKDLLFTEELIEILDKLQRAFEKESGSKCVEALKKKLPKNLCDKIDFLTLKIEQYATEEDAVAGEINECQMALRIAKIKQAMSQLQFEIKAAQSAGDKKMLKDILNKFNALSGQLMILTNPVSEQKKTKSL